MTEKDLLEYGWRYEFGGWISPNKKSIEDFGNRFDAESRLFEPPTYDFETACQIQQAINNNESI